MAAMYIHNIHTYMSKMCFRCGGEMGAYVHVFLFWAHSRSFCTYVLPVVLINSGILYLVPTWYCCTSVSYDTFINNSQQVIQHLDVLLIAHWHVRSISSADTV